MIDACLIEISRATNTEGIITQRAYGCRDHAAEIAEELAHNLASWMTWSREEDPDDIIEPHATPVETPEEPEEAEESEEDDIADLVGEPEEICE